MFCFLFCLVALGICAVSSADQNEQLFCGDVLNAECGICETWKREGKCKTRCAETLCLATCEHCKQDDKRTVLDVRYKGCYRDGFRSDFEKMIPMKREYLGVRSCTEECHLQGYPYAAVQDARFCMCSRQFGRYGAAEDESQCMTQCIAGSENERCGGPWKNAVYEIASRELQSGGVRLNDLSEKLLRALEKKDQPQPQAQFTGVLSDQLDRLRKRNRDYNPY